MKTPACLLLPALLGLFLGAPSMPSAKAAATAPAPVRLALDPMAAPRPALRYTFVHEMMDQTPGNAALSYHQVLRLLVR